MRVGGSSSRLALRREDDRTRGLDKAAIAFEIG